MEKRVIRKEDGRYLIFYGFERPIPNVVQEQTTPADEGAAQSADAAEKGGDA